MHLEDNVRKHSEVGEKYSYKVKSESNGIESQKTRTSFLKFSCCFLIERVLSAAQSRSCSATGRTFLVFELADTLTVDIVQQR